ncbi:M14 family metallopeptidase [Streptomyces resistomycificus]|uniref:succinylglutamate desuccinylase/aspartoacylase domain-containing protein n=1 Tax=Streptomyces resistomycificus TaxID=67356 RepID=UPI000A3E7E39|nr:succinylglutamate desuccinylase/aspartoacylase family protein [Streptomyces resistomycificus]
MNDATLSVGSLEAQPGTKARGTVRADLGTLTADIPLTLVNGSRPGPRVVITAGVHGGEFTPIDAVVRLADRLEPGEVHGQVIICPVANPPAVYQGRLNVSPVDGVNLNRVFPGDPAGGPTERLGAWLFSHLIDGADVYIDLHCGGIDQVLRDFVGHRLTGDPDLDKATAELAGSFGIEDVILGLKDSPRRGGRTRAAGRGHGAPPCRRSAGGTAPPGRPRPGRLSPGPDPRMGLVRRCHGRGHGPVVPGVLLRR